jgi:hypothetical protein
MPEMLSDIIYEENQSHDSLTLSKILLVGSIFGSSGILCAAGTIVDMAIRNPAQLQQLEKVYQAVVYAVMH